MTDSILALDPAKIKKILVCQLRQIGDVMLSTPVAELLAQKFPDAEIHYFTEKNVSLFFRTIRTFQKYGLWIKKNYPTS